MPERIEAFKAYSDAVDALVQYDEQSDPKRGPLVRDMFSAQRVFFHEFIQRLEANTQGINSLADRVQGHIARQLEDIFEEEVKARRVRAAILTELDVVAGQMREIDAKVNEILALLKTQMQQKEAGGE